MKLCFLFLFFSLVIFVRGAALSKTLYLVLLSISWVKTTLIAPHEAVQEIEKGFGLASVLCLRRGYCLSPFLGCQVERE